MNNSKNLEIEKTIDIAEHCYENKEYNKAFALCRQAEKTMPQEPITYLA